MKKMENCYMNMDPLTIHVRCLAKTFLVDLSIPKRYNMFLDSCVSSFIFVNKKLDRGKSSSKIHLKLSSSTIINLGQGGSQSIVMKCKGIYNYHD